MLTHACPSLACYPNPNLQVWKCTIHYYPRDKSCRVYDPKWDDERFANRQFSKVKLPSRFVKARAPCMKKSHGAISGNFEWTDFEYSPRAGSSEHFTYRKTMWKKPKVNVMGVDFTLHDAVTLDSLLFDGSTSELSDASLSWFLMSRQSDEDKIFEVASNSEGGRGRCHYLRPSELRAALWMSATLFEVRSVACCDKKVKEEDVLLPTAALLKYSTSQGGAAQLVRDLGRPGLNGCRASLEELKYMNVWREGGILLNLYAEVVGVVKQTASELFVKPVILYKIRVSCLRKLNGKMTREGWVILRRYSDFVALHRKLKASVTDYNHKGKMLTAGLKLLPSLPPKKSLNNVGVGNRAKFSQARGRKLGAYLRYLLNQRHVLWASTELVGFLVAFEVVEEAGAGEDEYGRSELSRMELSPVVKAAEEKPMPQPYPDSDSESNRNSETIDIARATAFQAAMTASINGRLKSIDAKEVQMGIFDLAKELLSLEKAAFLRGRLISVIRGLVTFMTSGSSFHKTLVRLHKRFMTGENFAEVFKRLREILWPGGEFLEQAEPPTLEEKVTLALELENQLREVVPDVLVNVVGQELAEQGLQTLYDIIQNDLVLKSISYQLVDFMLLELYPELNVELDCLHSIED